MIMKDIEKVILAAVLIALIVTEQEFAVVGVPEITQEVELRDKPVGSEPDEIIQEVTLPDIEGVVTNGNIVGRI